MQPTPNAATVKYSRHFAITAGVVVVLLAVVWFLRNSLIERMTSPMLAAYGLTLTHISLDALSSDNATIGYLELEHENGTTIAIDDLSLPISGSPTRLKQYSAKKVSIISATRDEDEPLEIAQLIDQFLSLPDMLGNTELLVGELLMPPNPVLRDLRVVVQHSEQRISATVEAMALSATVTPTNDGNHAVALTLLQESPNAPTLAINAVMQHDTQNILLSGLSTLDLPAWQPLTQFAGIVPQEIEIQLGTADLQFKLEIPYDTSQSASVSVELTPAPPLEFIYTDESGVPIFIKVLSGSAVLATATFPDVDWALSQQKSSLLVSYEDWTEIPVRISDLTCKATGLQCTMKSSITLKNRRLPVAKVGQLAWSSAQTVAFLDDSLRVDIQADAALDAIDVVASDTQVKKLSAQLMSAATLELLDSGWQLAADSVDASVEGLTVSEGITVTMPVYLENLAASELADVLFMNSGIYIPQISAALESGVAKLPGVKGKATLKSETIAVDLETLDLHQNGTVVMRHNLTTGKGELDLANAGISFAKQHLSKRLAPWPYDWDVAAGLIFVDGKARWAPTKSATTLNGQASLRAEKLTGNYTDIAFVNLSTSLQAAYDPIAGLTLSPATLTVGLLETGVALESISANYTLNLAEMAVDVADLRMSAFGGTVSAQPFSFRTAAPTNTVTMNAEAIRLDRLLTLEEFSAVQVSGTAGAELPITIEGDQITVSNGRLFGEPPGGVIRYQPASAGEATDASSLGFVTRALSYFEYKTLTSSIDYNADGDLKLQLQLTGKSPNVDQNRPIVLNLGVENNVPQMLKSLRAARSVEEVLEKRMQK